jgi:periplasmic divalent cation tolerance protein
VTESAYIVLLITTTNTDEARRISNRLLNQRKAACVNIVPRVDSLFWWQGKLDSAQESLLIVKTKMTLLNEIVTLAREIHSYHTPEIIALPIVGGNQDYLDWIGRETQTKISGEDR